MVSCALLLVLFSAMLAASSDLPLLAAVKQQDPAAVARVLKGKVDVNATAGDGATALHWAAYHDAPSIVGALLASGARSDVANDLGVTPLHLASANGNLAIISQLLARGARPDAATSAGVTPLMEAARRGSAEVALALLKRGVDVNAAENARGQTALMWAAARQHPQVVKVLLEHRVDVHARTRVRSLTVMLDQGPRRTVKTAAQDARQVDAGGSTALTFAAYAGDTESTRLLVAAGSRLDARAADGRSALVAAAFAGHGEVARLLLDAGSDPNAAGAGYTALHAAVLRGDSETVDALIKKGANVDAPLTRGSPVRRFGSQWALPQTMAGATPAFVAAAYLEVDILRRLLNAGANPSAALSSGGVTPLLAAAGAAVEKSARPPDLRRWNVIDSDTPQIPRAEADVVESVRLLIAAGADVNQASAAGDSAVHAAAAAGMTRVIQLLADAGATLDGKNSAGQTPLSLTAPRNSRQESDAAVATGLRAAEELLRKLGARY